MQSTLAHLQVNVAATSLPFYAGLFDFLGWQTIHQDEGVILGTHGGNDAALWFYAAETRAVANDYDGPGTNHIAIGVTTAAAVDEVAAYLREHGVALLFDTPRHRPDFAAGEGMTYYQVMFASPDNLLFEVVYTGPQADSSGA